MHPMSDLPLKCLHSQRPYFLLCDTSVGFTIKNACIHNHPMNVRLVPVVGFTIKNACIHNACNATVTLPGVGFTIKNACIHNGKKLRVPPPTLDLPSKMPAFTTILSHSTDSCSWIYHQKCLHSQRQIINVLIQIFLILIPE